MSLIIHMKIPGAIVAASDCRITGTEPLFVPVQTESKDENGQKVIGLGKPEKLNPQKKNPDSAIKQIPFGHYDYIKTDTEQKTFLFRNNENKPFAISYCGNANLNGYPTSYQIKRAMKSMVEVKTTTEIADAFLKFWEDEKITPPSLLISAYVDEKASVLEMRNDGTTVEHLEAEDVFGFTHHGEQGIVNALLGTGKFEYSLFRIQDAIEFCKTMIATTAKIQSFQKRQQTVSEKCDMLIITDEEKAAWINRDTLEW